MALSDDNGFLDDLPELDMPGARRAKRREKEKAVIWHIIHCPKCGSKNVPVHTTKRPVRYHICSDCGHKFKSVER